jgi:hypothetical protein
MHSGVDTTPVLGRLLVAGTSNCPLNFKDTLETRWCLKATNSLRPMESKSLECSVIVSRYSQSVVLNVRQDKLIAQFIFEMEMPT